MFTKRSSSASGGRQGKRDVDNALRQKPVGTQYDPLRPQWGTQAPAPVHHPAPYQNGYNNHNNIFGPPVMGMPPPPPTMYGNGPGRYNGGPGGYQFGGMGYGANMNGVGVPGMGFGAPPVMPHKQAGKRRQGGFGGGNFGNNGFPMNGGMGMPPATMNSMPSFGGAGGPVNVPDPESCISTTLRDRTKMHHCILCGRMFKKKEHAKRHVRLVHQQKRPFYCEVCNMRFGTKQNYRSHLTTARHEQKLKGKKK